MRTNRTALLLVTLAVTLWAAAPASVTQAADDDLSADEPKPKDLGPPLVDDVASLKRLHPTQPVWLDSTNKQIVMVGESCKASYPLEFLVTLPGREYESVMVVNVRPSIVHTGLLALGAEPGRTARFQPKFEPPTGTEVEIAVRWKDKDGKVQKARAQDWVRNMKTKKPLDVGWVFAGSGFSQDEGSGKRYYRADGGDFISVSNVPIATLDLPMESGSDLDARMFEGYVERMPPSGTPVTLILKPKVKAKADTPTKSQIR